MLRTVKVGYKVYGSAVTNYIRYFYSRGDLEGMRDLCDCLVPDAEVSKEEFLDMVLRIVNGRLKISGVDGWGEEGFTVTEDDGRDEDLIYLQHLASAETLRDLWEERQASKVSKARRADKSAESAEFSHDYGSDGWISPGGKFYRCGYQEHRFLAERILKNEGKSEEFGNEWDMDEHLQKVGWIKVSNGEFLRFVETYPVTMTKKQLDFIFDYLEHYDRLDKPIECFCETYKNYFELLNAFSER